MTPEITARNVKVCKCGQNFYVADNEATDCERLCFTCREPLKDAELADIAASFKTARYGYERFGVGPDWEHVYAGEQLLAEVRRLRAENAELRAENEILRNLVATEPAPRSPLS